MTEASRRGARLNFLVGLLAGVALSAVFARLNASPERLPSLGPVTRAVEASTGLGFKTRVDTGATVTSIHCPPEAIEIDGPAEGPADNVGKSARLTLTGDDGTEGVVTTRIIGYPSVRNAESRENRYEVRLRLRVEGVEKEAIVQLNDRSRMSHPLLLGREFLSGAFVVDVSDDPNSPY